MQQEATSAFAAGIVRYALHGDMHLPQSEWNLGMHIRTTKSAVNRPVMSHAAVFQAFLRAKLDDEFGSSDVQPLADLALSSPRAFVDGSGPARAGPCSRVGWC